LHNTDSFLLWRMHSSPYIIWQGQAVCSKEKRNNNPNKPINHPSGRENPAPPRVIVLLETFLPWTRSEIVVTKTKKKKRKTTTLISPINHPSDLRSRLLKGGGRKRKPLTDSTSRTEESRTWRTNNKTSSALQLRFHGQKIGWGRGVKGGNLKGRKVPWNRREVGSIPCLPLGFPPLCSVWWWNEVKPKRNKAVIMSKWVMKLFSYRKSMLQLYK